MSIHHPPPPTMSQPSKDYTRTLHNTALAALITCPLLALLPPRKLDFYTFGLGATTVFSASWLVRESTGRSVWQHLGVAPSPSPQPMAVQMPMMEGMGQREGMAAMQKLEGVSVTGEVQRQRDAWKVVRQREIEEEVEEGKGFGDMIWDQIWEVWHWRKRTDEDE